MKLEAEIYRPRLIPVMLRLTAEQIAKIDAERRIPTPNGVPSRCAVVRELVDEGFAFRLAARPKSPPRAPKGEAFFIDLSDC